jgi:photosystem II stability/assembly factor-like uncharacterized protein
MRSTVGALVIGSVVGFFGACGQMSTPTQCTIDGATFASGAANPSPDIGVCQVCTPAVRTSGWTNAKLGLDCGGGKQCVSGGRCARVFTPLTGTGSSTWYDIGGTASEVWLVGPMSQALRSVDRGATWTPMNLPGLQYRYGIFSAAPGQAFVVGTGGSVLSTTNGGATWTPVRSPMDRVLRGIWGRSSAELYVVGADGFIARTTNGGQAWQALRSTADGGLQLTLYGVWGDATGLFVVGEGGTILKSTDGTSFMSLLSTTSATLVSVHGTGQSIFVVGSSGTVLRSKDGQVFSALERFTRSDLTDVWGLGADVFVSTAGGEVFASDDDGATWRELSTAGALELNTIWGTSAQDVYTAGVSGVVLRTP